MRNGSLKSLTIGAQVVSELKQPRCLSYGWVMRQCHNNGWLATYTLTLEEKLLERPTKNVLQLKFHTNV